MAYYEKNARMADLGTICNMLAGRVAIITGASSGVGECCAKYFAEQGADVVICARRKERLEELAKLIRAEFGRKCLPVQCDVANWDDIDAVVDACIKEFGKVDILVNNAQGGLNDPDNTENVTYEKLEFLWKTGPVAALRFSQQCFPHMKEANYGRIINVSSLCCYIGLDNFATYVMAKGSLSALSRIEAKEWAKYGIRTNAILPQCASEAIENSPMGQEMIDKYAASMPCGMGDPYKDIAPVVAMLASEEARYINGQTLALDGGNILIA